MRKNRRILAICRETLKVLENVPADAAAAKLTLGCTEVCSYPNCTIHCTFLPCEPAK